jgi:hypothetical protein
MARSIRPERACFDDTRRARRSTLDARGNEPADQSEGIRPDAAALVELPFIVTDAAEPYPG